MTKNNTVEKIDQIINKIEENIAKKGLGEEEVKVLLMGIDSDLVGVKKSVEEKHKEIVDEKVKELRGKINESVSDEDPWWKVKDTLNKDVKDSLEGLKGKIIELEKPQVSLPVISVSEADSVELIKWRTIFPGQTPEQVAENLKNMASGMEEERRKNREEFYKIQKELEKIDSSDEIVKVSQNVMKMADKYVSDIGQKAIPVLGPLVGAGFGALHGLTEAAVFVGSKAGSGATDLAKDGMGVGADLAKESMNKLDKAREDLKNFSEHIADNTKELVDKSMDNIEKLRQGAENLTGKAMDDVTSVINKNIELAEKVVQTKAELKLGALKIELGDKKGDINEAKVEGKDEIIKNLKEELERKNAEIESLRKQVENQADKGSNQLLNVIEMITKSQSNSPVPSRPSTPSGGKQ